MLVDYKNCGAKIHIFLILAKKNSLRQDIVPEAYCVIFRSATQIYLMRIL